MVRNGRGTSEALVAVDGETTRGISYAELADHVARAAGAFLDAGIARGDRVGIYLPMWPEAAVNLLALALALARVGAVAVPMFSGYGTVAGAGRLADAGATALVTAATVERRGRAVDMVAVAQTA